jgi:phage tail-like protein
MNFKFHVTCDGKIVAGVNKVDGGFGRSVGSWRAGGDPSSPHMPPGQVDYGPITLELDVTQDVEFEKWANKVWDYPHSDGGAQSLADFRKDITITLLNEAGREVIAWIVYRCWVSDYSATPELDANGGTVIIRSLTLGNEGWSRIPAVHAPDGPGFDDPSS